MDALLVPIVVDVNPRSGVPGTEVSISGSGFKSNSSVSVYFNDTPVPAQDILHVTDNVIWLYAPAGSSTGKIKVVSGNFSSDDPAVSQVSFSPTFTYLPIASLPLELYWNQGNEDNATVAADYTVEVIKTEGYSYIRTEAYAFATQLPGTVPLDLYVKVADWEFATVSTKEAKDRMVSNGYAFIRTEGYVYAAERSFTLPLSLYFHEGRNEYFSTATEAGVSAAIGAGYEFISVEGYVLKERP